MLGKLNDDANKFFLDTKTPSYEVFFVPNQMPVFGSVCPESAIFGVVKLV